MGAKLNSEFGVVKVTVDGNELLNEVSDISNKEVDAGSKVEVNTDSSVDLAYDEYSIGVDSVLNIESSEEGIVEEIEMLLEVSKVSDEVFIIEE